MYESPSGTFMKFQTCKENSFPPFTHLVPRIAVRKVKSRELFSIFTMPLNTSPQGKGHDPLSEQTNLIPFNPICFVPYLVEIELV